MDKATHGQGLGDGLQRPLLEPQQQQETLDSPAGQLQRRITLAVVSSLAGNVALLLAKGAAFYWSWSMAVLASFIDSIIDLASQAVIGWADWAMSREDPQFPAGKARLETLSVIGCAVIMILGSVQVVSESTQQLLAGFLKGQLPSLDMSPLMYGILGAATVLKLGLWAFCFTLRHHSGAALALAEDHANDVASNLGAIITAGIASHYPLRYWWADPVGGIAISLYITVRWIIISKHQADKLVGRTAPPEFLMAVHDLVAVHHPHTGVGFLRAYHVGQRLAVDVELTAPARMTVAEAAAIARELKAKIEALPEVECTAVFVVHTASGVFRPGQRGPLIAPATRTKPHTTTADLDELLDGLKEPLPSETSGGTPSPGPASPRAGYGSSSDSAALAAGQAGAPIPVAPRPLAAGESASEAAGSPGDVEEGGAPIRRVATVALGSLGRLRHASQPMPAGNAPLAQQLAWSRSLKDAPDRVLQSASLTQPDTASMILARLGRRSLGPPLGGVAPQGSGSDGAV